MRQVLTGERRGLLAVAAVVRPAGNNARAPDFAGKGHVILWGEVREKKGKGCGEEKRGERIWR